LGYYLTKKGWEVDFVVSLGFKVEELIQVSYDVEDPDTIKRENKKHLKKPQKN